ncbi:MAG: thiol:disulfide interchange protein DsbD [Gammaproteobacteria bacterium]|nr:thiol:disulfide interchange protein DsbD [Gammaproteobacteria bacterium]
MKRLIFIIFSLVCWQTASAALTDNLQKAIDPSATKAADDEILRVDEAFIMRTTVTDPTTVHVHWQIAEGYYLYNDKFTFVVIEGQASVDQSSIPIPKGKVKEDPSFGRVEVLYHEVEFNLRLVRQSQAETPITLQIKYQGCKEDSICYPPQRKKVQLVLGVMAAPLAETPQPSTPVAAVTAAQTTPPATPAAQPATAAKLSEQDAITESLKSSGLFLNIMTFFGFGLLLSLTPCVFPMIPILSGIIVGKGEKITSMQGFTLSLAYVIAMALTYALAGVVAAMLNFNVQAAAQNVWVISVFSIIFILLSLSMFGFYEIQLPSSLQTRISKISDSQERGSLVGAFIMGSLSAIIVGPCVAPPLAGALLYISQTGDQLLGGLALFALGMGMGVPLLVIGGSAGSILPRAGMWMDTIKNIFGVLLIAVAVWFVSRIVPDTVELLLWAVLLIVTAIYMGALDQLREGATWQRLWKGIGIIMLIYGIVLLIGASSGSHSVLQPLQGLAQSSGTDTGHQAEALPFKRIKSLADLQNEVQQASMNGKSVMMDFYADWCIACIEMETYTFPEPAVHTALSDVVLLQADVTANDDIDQELMQHFDIFGPPAILFFGKDGVERKPYRLVGFVEADKFVAHVQEAFGS